MKSILAQKLKLPGGQSISGPEQFDSGLTDIGSILSKAIPYIFIFAGVGLLLMILSAGFTFLTSAGDPKKMEQGKQRLTNGLIGFLIIFASFWIVQIFGVMFGLQKSILSVF